LLLEHARALGVHRLGCEVLDGNAAAEALYGSLGFADDGSYELAGRRFRRLVAIL
jgi:RimJ/RimL family protein N-acetyltransferase